MKTFLFLFVFATAAAEVHASCNRPTDPKKVVLMLSFHDGAEEERGARQAACERGETLVVLPKPSADSRRMREQLNALQQRALTTYRQMENCSTDACRSGPNGQLNQIAEEASRLEARLQENAPDFSRDIQEFLQRASGNGIKVSSLILSGHDGGGSYYGDYGGTDIAEISNFAKENPGVFADTSSLLLMGCWTGTPDQVEQWRMIFPKVRVIGGFVGSAPASTRVAAGTYVSGILRGERNLSDRATRASVESMVRSVQHLNMVTAGVFINPACEEESERSPAYYYISPANDPSELPSGMRVGLNTMPTLDSRRMACMRAFGSENVPGTFDWNAVTQYFQGEREPENNTELRGLYSFLRNNQACFEEGEDAFSAPFEADQLLFLRFFQDTKKNFNKYFKDELEAMYATLDRLVAESNDPTLSAIYEKHTKLVGDPLVGMTRRKTIQEISRLQGIFDRVYRGRQERSTADLQVARTLTALDTHLYRMRCLPPTWHEYAEGETLAPPQC